MSDLAEQSCGPCNRLTPRLSAEKIGELSITVSGWGVREEGRLSKSFRFRNFSDSLEFVKKVAQIAEAENHHPEIRFGWGFVELTIWTHAINGLSMNDFILAAKIDSV